MVQRKPGLRGRGMERGYLFLRASDINEVESARLNSQMDTVNELETVDEGSVLVNV